MYSIERESREAYPVYIDATVNGSPYNPSGDQVQFAFVISGTNGRPTVWYDGAWDTNPVAGTSTHTALCIVGPGGTVVLDPGTYSTYVKITDSPEVPVIPAGLLKIT